MTVEIISLSISTKVWDRAGIELATPWICNQTGICSQTCYRLHYTAGICHQYSRTLGLLQVVSLAMHSSSKSATTARSSAYRSSYGTLWNPACHQLPTPLSSVFHQSTVHWLRHHVHWAKPISLKSCMLLLFAEIFEASLTNSEGPDQTAPLGAV